MLHRPASLFRLHSQQLSGSLITPFNSIFFPSFSPKTLRFASQGATTPYYAFLPNTADRRGVAPLPTQRRSQYPCTAPTAKISEGVPPNNKFQQAHKFIPYKSKLLRTTITSFRRHTARKNCKTPKFRTHQFTVRGRSAQQTTLNFAKTCPKQHVQQPQSHRRRRTSTRNESQELSRSPRQVQETTLNVVCNKKNYLGRAFPTRAQQGTSTIKQGDHHEHEGKGQRHCIETRWRLLFRPGGPPLRDDDRSHQDANDREQYVLPQIRSSTIPGRVANYSRLPLKGTLDG